MSMTVSAVHAPNADPNVTPLIDVLLVLLIIFMVIVPVTPTGLAVLVPLPPRHAPVLADAPMIVLRILDTPAGPAYRINGSRIDGKARLAAVLNRIYATRANRALFVQGDPGLSFAAVAQVIDLSRAAGVDRVGILTPAMTRE